MAKLEIPSIVVHNNNGTGGGMERQRPLKSRLSKQAEFEELDEEEVTMVVEEDEKEGDKGREREKEDDDEKTRVKKGEQIEEGGGNRKDGDETTNGKQMTMKGRSESNERMEREKPNEMPMIKAASVDGSPCPTSGGTGTGLKERSESTSALQRQRVKVKDGSYVSHPKVKLLQRSHALRDDTSPPPEIESNTLLSVTSSSSSSSQNKILGSKHHRLGKQGSSAGSVDSNSSALSRDSSLEQYTDSTGVDLQQFIVDTLHKNQKDRILLLKIEQELISLVKDNKRQHFKFPQMSGYQRMFVHRVAAFFGLDHNIDQMGTSVIVNKTKNTRLPDMKFRDQIRDELVPDEPKRSILKRDSSSLEDNKDLRSPERQLSSESRRSKSFEEREEEYGKSSSSQEGAVDSPQRSHESTHNSSRRSSQEDLRWPSEPRPWSSTDSDSSNRPNKLVITKTSASTESEPSSSDRLSASGSMNKMLTKSESAESGGSRDSLHPGSSRRAGVPKASSFGGISVLARADSAASTKSASPRLTTAESFSSSSGACSSAGYRDASVTEDDFHDAAGEAGGGGGCLTIKSPVPTATASTQSQVIVTSTVSSSSLSSSSVTFSTSATSPIAVGTPLTPHSSFPSYQVFLGANTTPQQGQPVMWAVSNMESVPPGSILINPQTGQPYLNTDGSVYRHNPSNPAPFQPLNLNNSIAPSTTNLLRQQTPPSVTPAPPLTLHHHQQQLVHPVMMSTTPPSVSSSSRNPQSPFMLCTPTLHTAMLPPPYDRRQFSVDSSVLSDVTSHLSGLTLASVPLQQHGSDILATGGGGGGGGGEALLVQQGSATASHHSSFTLGQPMRPSSQQQTSQLYYVPSSQQHQQQALRYICQVPYTTALSQSVAAAPPPSIYPHSHLGLQFQQGSTGAIAAATFDGQILQQQQQQQSQPLLQSQGSQQQQAFQLLPGDQCFHHTYPVVGYGQQQQLPPPPPLPPEATTYGVTPYYALSSPHVPVSSSGFTYPAYAYTVATSIVNPSVVATAANNLNPSQTTFVSGPVPICGLMSSATGGGGNGTPTLQLPPPPPLYHQSQNSFRPQTPPTNQSQGLALAATASQQHPSSVQCLGQSISLATPNPQNFTLYSTTNVQPQQSQQQQLPAVAPTSRTPPQFSTAFTPQFLTSLPLFRPNVQMMVGSNTPPPPPHQQCPPTQNFLSTGTGQQQYAPTTVPPPFSKSFNMPLVDQRFMKASDLYVLDASGALGDYKAVTALPFTAVANGPNPASVVRPTALYGRGLPLVQGDMRLIGTPLQHQMQTPIRIPLMIPQQRPTMTHFQSTQHQGFNSAAGRPPKIKRQRSKGGSTPSKGESLLDSVGQGSIVETERGKRVLEVQGLPDGLRKSEVEHYVEDVIRYGAKLHFIRKSSCSGSDTSEVAQAMSDFVITNKVYVYAVFESETEAQNALLHVKTTKFQLRLPTSKNHLHLTLDIPAIS